MALCLALSARELRALFLNLCCITRSTVVLVWCSVGIERVRVFSLGFVSFRRCFNCFHHRRVCEDTHTHVGRLPSGSPLLFFFYVSFCPVVICFVLGYLRVIGDTSVYNQGQRVVRSLLVWARLVRRLWLQRRSEG